MHYLTNVIQTINKDYPHLGELVAVCMLATKARKCLLVAAPRGCGKSRASAYIGKEHPQPSIKDRISAAGLGAYQDEFTGFTGVVIVDDLAKTQSRYARVATMTTIAELVYSHYVHSGMQGSKYDIVDFYGAALVNVQPVLLKELVKSDEWEASMQDKSMRYYHLYRPQKPNPDMPLLKLDWGFDFAKVARPKLDGKLAHHLLRLGESQWGLARTQEHISDLLKAAAALDKRDKVQQADYALLSKVLRPMGIESVVTGKNSLESDRFFFSNRLAILVEYYTYGAFTLEQISRDYKLSQSQCRRIIETEHRDWELVKKNPTTYAPSESLLNELRLVGLLRGG